MPSPTIVLLVEDESMIRVSTAQYFEDAGYTVFEAETAHEAILIIEQNEAVSIVFTDVDLGDEVDGVALLHLIASRWPPIRLFATSGAVNVPLADLPAGAAFFPKPYNHATVVESFEQAMIAANPPPKAERD
ncbi:response regulator [Sphingomonas sp. ASV193]|uniref:response regulator n=1 Tax=Sphingomonas sp. ASV193 TaxID=3144405 RepID=UPI0032E8E6CD